MYPFGLSISYKRVDQIQASVAKELCEQRGKKSLVVPKSVQLEKYISAAIDYINHNVTSNTTINYFHRTSITIFQHCHDEEHNYIINNENKVKVDADDLKLPLYYINIQPA